MAATLKTALVTGAGSGIGHSTLRPQLGPKWDSGSPWWAKPSTRAGRTSEKGRDSAYVATCDIADRPAVKAVSSTSFFSLRDHRRPGLERGNQRPKSQPGIARSFDWDRMIATNPAGSFSLVHHVLPLMRASQRAGAGDARSARYRACGPAPWEAPATQRQNSARPRWASASGAKRGHAVFALR